MSTFESSAPKQGKNLRISPLTILQGHEFEVARLKFSPDGRLLASREKTISRLWQESSSQEWALQRSFSGIVVHFYDDGGYVALTIEDNLEFWSKEGRLLRSFTIAPEGIFGDLYSPDGKWWLTVDWQARCYIWDTEAFQLHEVRKLILEEEQADVSRFPCFTPDGKYLFFISRASLYQCLFTSHLADVVPLKNIQSSAFSHIAMSPTGLVLAAANELTNCVDLYDPVSLTLQSELSVPEEDAPEVLAFSPDGQFLACAGNAGNVYVWDIQTSQQVYSFVAHPGVWTEQAEAIYGFAWSPHGDILATGGGSHFLGTMTPDASIKLWKVEFGHNEEV